MMKVQAIDIATHGAEWMHIAAALSAPTSELNAELIGCLCRANKIVFVDAQQCVELADVGYGRLANTHGTNLFGFDQANPETVDREKSCEGSASHPDHGDNAAHDNKVH